MSGQEAAVALLATLHACHFDLGEYGIRIWLDYDFGGEATHRPYLETSRTDDAYCAEIRSSLEVDLGPGVGNVFYARLLLWLSPTDARVESFVEAHLDQSIGEYGPGSYVLYERRSDNLDIDGALRAAREHVDALHGIEDYPKTLGLSRR
ncbi:hypothetical protein ACIBF5_18860 [Micromonospora sp. NPDC050417]|uniref:hypothetical protein n=1 Tax=Micromonospora sp. NPDC050417 TaxID=3364280 RepID=UPI0037B799CC